MTKRVQSSLLQVETVPSAFPLSTRAQLFKIWKTYSLDKLLSRTANVIPFDAFDKDFANDYYTFTVVLYKFHMAARDFSYILHPQDSSLSNG